MGILESLERLGSSGVSPSSGPPSPAQSPLRLLKPPAGRTHVGIAIVSAVVGLFLFPEIFDSAAIILGAYAWKRQQGNTGLYVVILGIACMLIGLYFTAYALINLFP
jgi:hypothetical protein